MRFPIALYLHWTPRETRGGWAVFCLRDRFSGPKWLHLTVGLPSDRRNRKLAAAIATEPPKAERPYIGVGRRDSRKFRGQVASVEHQRRGGRQADRRRLQIGGGRGGGDARPVTRGRLECDRHRGLRMSAMGK